LTEDSTVDGDRVRDAIAWPDPLAFWWTWTDDRFALPH
jgi:hypothetical protein